MKITIKMYDANGDETELSLPARFDVCPDCDGHGTHLTPGMRDHAYSAEEFAADFDDDDRDAYFGRGGKFDVTCETCKGARVMPVVDEAKCDKSDLANYHAHLADEAEFARESAAERRMGY